MNNSVDDTTDIVQLDAEPTPDEEFAAYMKAEHPQIEKDSANWNLIKRGYDQENMIDGDSPFDLACKIWRAVTDSPIPSWASGANLKWIFPSQAAVFSAPARVSVLGTRSNVYEGNDGSCSVRTGRLDVWLYQRPTQHTPWITFNRWWNTKDGDFEMVKGSDASLTLTEAAELAHVLLLMVDIARESADEIAGA